MQRGIESEYCICTSIRTHSASRERERKKRKKKKREKKKGRRVIFYKQGERGKAGTLKLRYSISPRFPSLPFLFSSFLSISLLPSLLLLFLLLDEKSELSTVAKTVQIEWVSAFCEKPDFAVHKRVDRKRKRKKKRTRATQDSRGFLIGHRTPCTHAIYAFPPQPNQSDNPKKAQLLHAITSAFWKENIMIFLPRGPPNQKKKKKKKKKTEIHLGIPTSSQIPHSFPVTDEKSHTFPSPSPLQEGSPPAGSTRTTPRPQTPSP